MATKFSKTDIIKTKPDNKIWQCIVADDELAVFGLVMQYKQAFRGHKTSYTRMFVVSQDIRGDFKFVNYVGRDEYSGRFIFEDDDYSIDENDVKWLN